MAIIYRRVFQAKTGKAGDVVALYRDYKSVIEQLVPQTGVAIKGRISTDYLSGRTDRVIEELEVESIGAVETLYAKIAATAELGPQLAEMQQRLFELIEYSEVEYLAIQQTF